MKKSAYIFSGIDGLDSMKDRIHMLTLPSVVDRIVQAQRILDQVAPEFQLTNFIASPNEVFQKELTLQALAISVVQIGLFDLFQTHDSKPEYLMGCSLGDLARTYCAGAIDFEVLVQGCWHYHLAAQTITGAAYHVKSIDGDVTEGMIKEITDFGVYLAVQQTPKHFLIAGEPEKMEIWRNSEIEKKRFRINPLYNKPLHTPMMNAVTEKIHALYSHTLKCETQWKYKMVSSTHIKILNTKEELLADMIENFNSTVRWMQALQFAANELEITRFVNVGPAHTLLLFADRTPLNQEVELVNFFSEASASSGKQAAR